jgi:small subunit ribosomal protein S20
MANIKGQIKRNRQNEKLYSRNKGIRSEINSRVKNALSAAESGSDSDETLRIALKRIDKAAAKNIIHKNTAARRKSRLVRRFNDLTK